MVTSSLASLDGLASLAEIGLRGGVDMRPTLLRVLTDLYMQKMRHTPEEEQHYCELALRLLEVVDAQTRSSIAARLARHLLPPFRVIQSLVNDLPEIAAPLRSHPLLQPPNPKGVSQPLPAILSSAVLADEKELDSASIANLPGSVDPAAAHELNELFFTANANERGLILRNLEVIAPISPGQAALLRNPAVGQRLEAAALGRNREAFAQHLAQSLRVVREQGRRIARDPLGEPIVIALKALNVSRDIVYRILMFANPTVGHSVERVHALAELHDEITIATAEGIVVIWQALHKEERAETKQRPPVSSDETRPRDSPAAAIRRSPVAAQMRDRRDAS